MRFALLGNHPDGVAFARALAASGRHELVRVTAPVPFDVSRPKQAGGDLEEVLADPAIEAIIVAGPLTDRPALLRRSLQSERHVVCVHPADHGPETAYEAALIRQDVRCVLLPLLFEALHPAISRLAEFIERAAAASPGPVGPFRLLTVDRAAVGEVLFNLDVAGARPCLPGWDILRRWGARSRRCRPSARQTIWSRGTWCCWPVVSSMAGCSRRRCCRTSRRTAGG